MSPLWSPAFWLQTAVQSFCSLFSKHKGLSGYRPQCPRMFAENDLHAGSASPHRWSSCSPSPSSSHLLQLPFFPCCPLCGASTFHTIKKRSVLFFFFSCPPCLKSEWERTLSRRRLLAARLQNSQMRMCFSAIGCTGAPWANMDPSAPRSAYRSSHVVQNYRGMWLS